MVILAALLAVFEIKVLFCAPARYECPKNGAPGHLVTYYVNLLKVGKSMHTPGAWVSKSMHPAAKMCTQGVGCTLNFKH